MSALSPGLYRATVEGVPNILIMVTDDQGRGTTTRLVPDSCQGTRGHSPEDITDARPLIVLDLDERHTFTRALLGYLRRGAYTHIADQIEAQVKPARIPEPGLWGVVVAEYDGQRRNFVNDQGWNAPAYTGVRWADLIDPTLLRRGLGDES